MSAFDTPAVSAAFELFIGKCKVEIAAGNEDYLLVPPERSVYEQSARLSPKHKQQ